MLLRLPTVMLETGLSRSSICAAIKQGAFPRPVRIGKRAVAWRARDVEDWKATRREAPSLLSGSTAPLGR